MPVDIREFYPPHPTNVPPQLTRPTQSYRIRAGLVVASLFLFVLVYLGLIVGFGGFSAWAFVTLLDMENFRDFQGGGAAGLIILLSVSGLSAGLLALYFIKGLFKFPKGGDDKALEITEADQPRLFAFIRQVCADTGAPAPAKIVLSPEVGASVFFPCTFWNLFFPIRKNLHIGLGLVNSLNLSEFKAVLAHEFGHFSQRSMRLGAYVYTANRVIGEIIYGRDWLDDSLKALGPVLKVIRWLLGGVFRVVNFANSSLSRQMEFQADLVAVSVAGSDAIVHGLLRTDLAQQCLDQTWRDLTAASDHRLWTKDLFHHQGKSAEYLRILKDDPKLGLPPPLNESGEKTQVFPPNETVLPPMWASHPPHHEREKNCKATYIRCPQDERPAWIVFDDPDGLRQKITARHYELGKPKEKFAPKPAEVLQRFIDDERAETVYSARYHGMYEDGVISPGPIEPLLKSVPTRYEQPKKMLAEHAAIFSAEMRDRLAVYRERRKDQDRLYRFANKIELPKDGTFKFRDKNYRTAADAAKLLTTLQDEIKVDNDYLAGLDKRIFLVYMGMAGQLDRSLADELEYRYRFHLRIQDIDRKSTR